MKFKLRPFFKDVSLTFITEFVVFLSFFVIYRLIAKNFGPEGVGEYSLVKRVIGFLYPILLLGLGIGLPRYIAMSKDEKERSIYIKVGGLAIAIFTLIFLIIINLFKSSFAKIFFGSTTYINLVLPFSLLLAGMNLHTFVYSYFRGRLFVRTFNLLQIVNFALVPVLVLIIFKKITVEQFITSIGIGTLLISFAFSFPFIKGFFLKVEKWQLKKSSQQLFSYSLPRIPGLFIYAGLFSLGPIFATHFASIKEVGYLSISQSLLGTIGAAIAPLGLIILAKVSNLVSNGKQEIIKENLNVLLGAVIQCSIFICFQLIIFCDIIIKFWLGSGFYGAIPIMRIIFISTFFYALYESTRNILDAIKIKPINTINLFISLSIFLIIIGLLLYLINFFSPIISLSIALTVAIICLGSLTYKSIRKIYPEKLSKDLNYLWVAIGINILLGIIAVSIKPFIIFNFYYLIFFEILICLIYFVILWFLQMEWIIKIPKILFYYNK